MSLVKITRIPWRRTIALSVGAMLVSTVAYVSAAGDPHSDFFQPDILRTGSALAQRTPGLTDPFGRDCALPAEPLSLAELDGVLLVVEADVHPETPLREGSRYGWVVG